MLNTPSKSRRAFCSLSVGVLGSRLLAPGWAIAGTPDKKIPAIPPIDPPKPVHGLLDEALARFGKLLRAVDSVNGERDIVIAVDPSINISGNEKDLPIRFNPWMSELVEKVGKPLRTYESVPTSAQFGSPFPAVNPAQSDRPKHPDPALRITGTLTRVYERKMTAKDWEFYLRAGNGAFASDGQGKRQSRSTVTSMTLQVSIQQPDGLVVRGGIASYRVDVIKDEVDHSWSLYVGGTGLSRGNNVTLQSDAGEGIRSALAAALITALGNALEVSWYRCDSTLFPVDEELDARVRARLNRMTQSELERRVKHYLFLSTAPMDMTGPQLTPKDRELVTAEMLRRSLNPTDRAALESLAFTLWKEVDIDRAAEIVDRRMSDIARQWREAEEKRLAGETERLAREAREAQWNLGPAHFGWAESMILLDLTRLKDAGMRNQILAAARTCPGCEEVKAANAERTAAAIRLSTGKEATDPDLRGSLQQTLKRISPKIDFVWTGSPRQRLCVFEK